MAVNYRVQAQVVDIRSDTPKESDSFLVDTNVWYWMCYPRASLSLDLLIYQLTHYPEYLKKARLVKAKLYRFGLSLAELTHRIEVTEREVYGRKPSGTIDAKEYRHNIPAG